MNKITNNKIIFFSFGILTILTFIGIPTIASAQYGGYIPSGNSNQYPYNTYQNTNPAPVYNIYQTTTTTTPTTVTPTPTPAPTVAKKATTGKIVASAKVTSPTNNGISTNSLVSNALFGSNTAYPSSLLQWLFLAILIIFIIILVRRVYGSREKYLASPLKHD